MKIVINMYSFVSLFLVVMISQFYNRLYEVNRILYNEKATETVFFASRFESSITLVPMVLCFVFIVIFILLMKDITVLTSTYSIPLNIADFLTRWMKRIYFFCMLLFVLQIAPIGVLILKLLVIKNVIHRMSVINEGILYDYVVFALAFLLLYVIYATMTIALLRILWKKFSNMKIQLTD